MGAPLWPQTSVLGLRPLEFRILCLLGNTIWVISPSSWGSHGSVQSICIQRWSKPNLFIRLLIHAQTWEPQTQYVATNRGFKSPLHLTALNLNFVGLFSYDRLIGILTIVFLAAILIGILDFRFRTSAFKFQRSEVPHWAFALLKRYIYLLGKWNCIQRVQNTHWIVSLSTWCCITVCDASPTLKQH